MTGPAHVPRRACWPAALRRFGLIAATVAALLPSTVAPAAETVTVDVQGELGFSVFPGGWSVHAHAEAPVERFLPEPER